MSNSPSLNDLENRLYESGAKISVKPRRAIHDEAAQVPRSWGTGNASYTPKPKKSRPILAWFFLAACGFAVLSFVVMSLSLSGQGRSVSNRNIEVQILGKGFAEGGEELEYEVVVRNSNNAPLQLSDLVLEHPETGDADTRVNSDRRDLGTIAGRSERSEKFNVRLYGAAESTIPLTARLEYRITGSNSIFVKETVLPVVLRSAPVSLVVTGSKSVAQNQEARFTITVASQSRDIMKNVAVKVEYPDGFVPSVVTPEADIGKYFWSLGDLPPGQEKKIEITGQLRGEVNQALSFRAYVGERDAKNERAISTLYASQAMQLAVAPSFLSTKLIINGSQNDTVALPAGASVTGFVSLQNATSARVRDIEVTADLSGDLFDPASVRAGSGGFYDSANRRIVWNRSTGSRAAIMDPGTLEQLDFDIEQLAVPNGSMTITVSIKGIGIDGSPYVVNKVDSATIQRAASLSFGQTVMHDGGSIANTGPVPPVVNEPTTYTINWSVPNPTSNLSDYVARATLPSYVTWTGQSSPQGADITYSEATREVVWRAGSVATNQSPSVVFQVSITPSASQANQVPKLTNDVKLQAYDTRAGVNLTASRAGLTTRLTNGASGSGTVQAPAAPQ